VRYFALWMESVIFLVCGRKVCILLESDIFGAMGEKCVFCGVMKVRYFGMCEECVIFSCVRGTCLFCCESKVRYFGRWKESAIFWWLGAKCVFFGGRKVRYFML